MLYLQLLHMPSAIQCKGIARWLHKISILSKSTGFLELIKRKKQVKLLAEQQKNTVPGWDTCKGIRHWTLCSRDKAGYLQTITLSRADLQRSGTQSSSTRTPTSSLHTQHLSLSYWENAISLPPHPNGEDTLSLTLTHLPRSNSLLDLSALGPHTALQEPLKSSPCFLKACPGVKLQRFLFLCHFPSLLPLLLAPPTLSGHTVRREFGVHEDHCSSRAVSGPPQLKTISKSHFLSSPPWNDFC